MELKRRRFDIRKIVTVLYVVAFLAYLIVGLQPAEAVQYDVSSRIEIPSIGLSSDVTRMRLVEHKLATPDTIVGSYTQAYHKTLLVGHASTVFSDLNLVEVGEKIYYGGKEYVVNKIEFYRKEDVEMDKVLMGADNDTIIVMTCAGKLYGTDASHRLLVTATAEE